MYNSEIYIIWILFFFLLFFFYQFVTTRVYTLFEQCVNFGGVGDSEKHLDLMQRERESERAAHIIQQHDPIPSQQHRAERESCLHSTLSHAQWLRSELTRVRYCIIITAEVQYTQSHYNFPIHTFKPTAKKKKKMLQTNKQKTDEGPSIRKKKASSRRTYDNTIIFKGIKHIYNELKAFVLCTKRCRAELLNTHSSRQLADGREAAEIPAVGATSK